MTISVHLDSWSLEGQDPILAALVEVEAALGSADGGRGTHPPSWLHHLHRAQIDAAAIAAWRSPQPRDIPLEARAAENVDLMRKRAGIRRLIASFLHDLPSDLGFVIVASPEACSFIRRVGLPVQEEVAG